MKRLPEDFTNRGELMSNFDHQINQEVAEAIKGNPLLGTYAGWNFYGYCWWDGIWNCEVWTHGSYSQTISAPTLEELMMEVSGVYGQE